MRSIYIDIIWVNEEGGGQCHQKELIERWSFHILF